MEQLHVLVCQATDIFQNSLKITRIILSGHWYIPKQSQNFGLHDYFEDFPKTKRKNCLQSPCYFCFYRHKQFICVKYFSQIL